MVITAWIVFIILMGLLITNSVIYKKNEIYRNKIKATIKKKWTIVITIVMIPILIYTVGTSFLIMVQGDCFVGYYGGWNYENGIIYYNDSQYYWIFDPELKKEAYEYGAGEWAYTDTYIKGDSQIHFPYVEYWRPKLMRNELILPGELEPVYIRVQVFGTGTIHYIRQDMFEEWQK